MHQRQTDISDTIFPIAILATFLIIAAALGWGLLLPAYHWAWVFVRSYWVQALILLAAVVLFLLGAQSEHPLLFAGSVLTAVGAFAVMFLSSYWSDHALYVESNVQESADASDLDYAARTPFDVADAVSSRMMGSTTGDMRDVKTYLPADNRWTTTIDRRGWFRGYEAVQEMRLPDYGEAKASDVTFCTFSEDANLRLSNFWWNSLDLEIARKTSPSTTWDSEDMTASCENGVPMVRIPLTRLKGVVFPHPVSGGVAEYDGKTGELRILDAYDGELPLYPMSLATQQREALRASGSILDWVFHRSGWQDTGDDKDDPNGDNRSEFSLYDNGDKTAEYVTPLTPRGSSSSIVAVGTIRSNHTQAGGVNPYSVHMFPDGMSRQANSAVAASITGNALSGYKAQGLTVFEIVPGAKGQWTATIGKSQSILYHADISLDGSITLTDASGQVVADNQPDANDGNANSGAGSSDADLQRLRELLDEATQLADKIQSERNSQTQ